MVDETNYENPLKEIEDAERASMDMSDDFEGMATKEEVEKSFGPEYEEELQKELKAIENSSEKTLISFSKIQDSIKNQIKKDLESINDTIGKFILSGVKGFSRSLAEAVVLGKELNKSFKELAQKLLVEALAFTIQMVIQEQIKTALHNFERRINNVKVEVEPRPDDNDFEVTVIFDIIGQDFPTQEFSFILEATR